MLCRCRILQQNDLVSAQSILSDASDIQSQSKADSSSRRFLRMFTLSQPSIPVRRVSDVHLVVEEEPNVQIVQV